MKGKTRMPGMIGMTRITGMIRMKGTMKRKN